MKAYLSGLAPYSARSTTLKSAAIFSSPEIAKFDSILESYGCQRGYMGGVIVPAISRHLITNGLAQVWQPLSQIGAKWLYPVQSTMVKTVDTIWCFLPEVVIPCAWPESGFDSWPLPLALAGVLASGGMGAAGAPTAADADCAPLPSMPIFGRESGHDSAMRSDLRKVE